MCKLPSLRKIWLLNDKRYLHMSKTSSPLALSDWLSRQLSNEIWNYRSVDFITNYSCIIDLINELTDFRHHRNIFTQIAFISPTKLSNTEYLNIARPLLTTLLTNTYLTKYTFKIHDTDRYIDKHIFDKSTHSNSIVLCKRIFALILDNPGVFNVSYD